MDVEKGIRIPKLAISKLTSDLECFYIEDVLYLLKADCVSRRLQTMQYIDIVVITVRTAAF